MSNTPPDLAIAALEKQFRKCSPETIRAIYDFRRDHDIHLVPQIVVGIMRKYVKEDAAERLAHTDQHATLTSLGVDSLTMMEIILDVQDAIDVTIADNELKGLRTIEEVSELLRSKLNPEQPSK
jgi:3-hydroxyacyl-[acyl-carrier-protein] dehydratase